MADSTEAGANPRTQALEDIEAIKRLKARYFRYLDGKLWDQLEGCFTEDAALVEREQGIDLKGAKTIIEFLSRGLGHEYLITVHQGHNPDIEVTGQDSARGSWALYDYMVNRNTGKGSRGFGYYDDQYARKGGVWKISSCTVTHILKDRFERAS